MIARERANFISDEADFAAIVGNYGEKSNEVSNKIGHSQPIDGILNKLLTVSRIMFMYLLV